MTKLNKGPKKLFDLLQTKQAGDVLTQAEILGTTGWTPVTFATYKKKNKVAPFLAELSDGTHQVVHDGHKLSERHFYESFTQVKPQIVAPKIGDLLQGKTQRYDLHSKKSWGQALLGKSGKPAVPAWQHRWPSRSCCRARIYLSRQCSRM